MHVIMAGVYALPWCILKNLEDGDVLCFIQISSLIGDSNVTV